MATDWGNDDLVITAPQEGWGEGDAVAGEWGAEDEVVPKSSYLRNLGSTAGKSAVTATGQAVGGIYRMADQLAALPQRIGIGAARVVGAIPQSEADLLNQLTDQGVRLAPAAANVRGASELAQISAGNIRSLADYYEPDPARAGEFSTQVAQAAGGLAPVLVSPATALPVLAGQFGEAERERAIAEGDSPEIADAKFTLGALGGGVLGAVPPLRVGGRPLVSAIGKIAGGAGINVAQDVAVQKLIEPNAPLDMDRVKFNAIFGALFGGAHAVPDVVMAVREISPRIAAKLGGAKTPSEAAKILRDEAANAADAEAAILNDAAKAIDDKASGIYDFPETGGIETPVDRLLKSRERAAQLAQARFEEAVQSLQQQLKRNQIGDAENIILEGTPAENQLLALDVKFGEGQGAVKERARLAQIISEERGIPVPETPREAQVAARLQGKTLEQQKQIIDQEIKLGKGTDPQSTQRKGLELKQNIETALDAQKVADERAKAQVDAVEAQQKAIADQQKAAQQAQAEAAKPAEVPKSTQILQEQAKPPVLANVAAETASMTQGSPFALQGALNKLTSPPVETPAPVNIGPRDASVSTGTGKPTAKEQQILAEQKRLIEEHQKQQGGASNGRGETEILAYDLKSKGFVPKSGRLVGIGVLPEYEFIAVKDGSNWKIYEKGTGLSVGEGHTRAVAIADAKMKIDTVGAEKTKNLIQQTEKKNPSTGGQPNAIPEQISNTRVLRPESQEPKLNVELQGVGEGNAQAKLPAGDQVRQGSVQEPLSEAAFIRDNAPLAEPAAGRPETATRQASRMRQTRGAVTVPRGKKQTETPEFKKWFGDSKVVDAEGKPLVVYHGTGADVSKFNGPTFFTTDKKYASARSEYKGGAPNVVPAYLSLANPMEVDIPVGKFSVPREEMALIERAIARGHDGLIINATPKTAHKLLGFLGFSVKAVDMEGNQQRYFVAFSPTQIKSAIGNRGTFDPNNPDIRAFGTPSVIAPVAGAASGAVGGFALTDRQPGEAEEEFKARRLRNTALGALAGASLLPFTRNIVRIAKKNANTVNALKSIQAEAIGSERMPEWYLKWRQRPGVVAVREAISNNRARVKDLVTKVAKDADVTNEQNPYLTGKLFPGRAAERVRQAEDVMRDVQKSIVEAGQASPLGVDEFIKRFNVWLEAKHTPYYNAALRRRAEDGEPITSRLTDAQAAEILADAGRDGYAPIFEELGKQYKDLTSATRKMLVDGGIISADTAAGWESTFPEYVPLNRILPEDSLETAVEKFLGGGPGMNVIGSGVYKIKGSDLQVADIGASIYANMLDAIRRVEKNRVDQAALNFFQGPGKNVPGIRITKPKFGEPFDENSQVAVRKNGERYVIEFQDPKLATAFSGLNSEGAGGLLRLLAYPTRWMSQLVTRFNPNFLAANPLRDRQETALKLASQGDWGGAVQQLNPKRVLFSDPKIVVDWFRNTGSPESALFQQMLDDGGMAGGWASATRKKADAIIAEMRKSDTNPIIDTKDKFLKFVDFLTDVSEGSTRYRAYKRALDLGATRDEAALAARNASVDFNQKGTVTSQAAALYAFINPAIQGPINSTKALIRNPETVASIATAFIGLGAAADQWNQSFDEDWKKRPSMQYARNTGIPIIYGVDEKTGDYKFASIPVAYALRPIKSSMDFMWDAARGDVDSENIGDELARVGAAVVDSTNPLGTSNIKTAFVPTIARPLAEVALNEKFTGSPIVPPHLEADRLIGDRAKRFLSNNDTVTGRMANRLSDLAYETIGADVSPNRMRYLMAQYTGGPGRVASNLINSIPELGKIAAGELDGSNLRLSDFPVTSAFFRRVSPEISERETPEYKRTEEFVRKSKTEQELIRQQARLFYRDNVEQIAPENRVAFVQEADRYGYIPKDAAFRSTLLSKLRNGLRGRDETDNLISQLSVASGERAKYYAQRFAEMEPDEVGPFINEQMERGLLTPDVAAQLEVLSAQQSRN